MGYNMRHLGNSKEFKFTSAQVHPFSAEAHGEIVGNLVKEHMDNVKAPDLLKKASNIMEERGKQYDSPEGERSMGKCIAAFNAITGHSLTEPEGWLLLQVLKDVRLFQKKGYHQDSAEDCIAYAALKAEAKSLEI